MGPGLALGCLLAFAATAVGSVVFFLIAGGGGTEEDTDGWKLIAPAIAAFGLVGAFGVGRGIGLRPVAWSVVGGAALALLLNVATGLSANLPFE